MTHETVFIICDSLPGALTSTAPMVDSLRRELERKGHETFVAGIGSEPHVRDERLAIYSSQLKSRRLWRRALAEASASIRLGLKLLWAIACGKLQRPSLIVVFVPSLFLCLPAFMVKLASRTKVYLVQRDIVPDWMVESGRLRPSAATRLLYALKNFSLRQAHHIGIECEENLRFFPDRYRSKISVLHNWRAFDEGICRHPPPSDRVVFVYGGRVGHVQGFDRFLKAFAELDHPGALLRIYCDDRGKAEIDAMGLSASVLRAIEIRPMLPEAAFLTEASRASFGVVTLAPEMQTHNIPGKVLAYMAAGVPVFALAPRNAALARVIRQLDIGCCAAAESEAEVREMLRREIVDPRNAARHREALARARASFSASAAAEAILAAVGQRERTLEPGSAT